MSKTIQNESLSGKKRCIQSYLVTNFINQSIGQLFVLMADGVTDASNAEQLGLVLRYMKIKEIKEKVFEDVQASRGK